MWQVVVSRGHLSLVRFAPEMEAAEKVPAKGHEFPNPPLHL